MPLSTDVIVRQEAVTFPQKCVVCGEAVDDEKVQLRANPSGFYGVIPWLLGRGKKLVCLPTRRAVQSLRGR